MEVISVVAVVLLVAGGVLWMVRGGGLLARRIVRTAIMLALAAPFASLAIVAVAGAGRSIAPFLAVAGAVLGFVGFGIAVLRFIRHRGALREYGEHHHQELPQVFGHAPTSLKRRVERE